MEGENNITNTIYCRRSEVSETNMLYEIWISSMEDNKIRQNQYDSNEGHVITSILFKKFSNLVSCGTEIIQFCCLVLVFPDVPKFYWYLTECHAEKKKKKNLNNHNPVLREQLIQVNWCWQLIQADESSPWHKSDFIILGRINLYLW